MACVAQFICKECRQSKHEVVVSSHICATCRDVIARADELAHMSRLAGLPMEERVRRIELALYQLDAEARLKALESHRVRY